METKPIVTTHGNQSVFSSLHKLLLECLPKEAAEWRRSYGRQARNVFLEASFVPYDDDILPDEMGKTLISRPYFHIFWTDCDLETYKQKVKEEITDWTSALKDKNISDWMIVVVNNDENKVKTKLLPRSSVYDKIKSDFCSKHSDRIVQLGDAQKSDQKSDELWALFLSKLRAALLQAFSKHLQKYEDNMRSLREKRNEVGWNFQHYFIVQEELAFMFEMLGLHEDALIQYDELDALFTQFVMNHASGRVNEIVAAYVAQQSVPETEINPVVLEQLEKEKQIVLESVPWLSSLVRPCTSWAGLSLQKPIAWERRNLIKDNEASLLEFRNYLFSRQCAVLLLLEKPGEMMQRAIDYLHETVQEMKTLEVEIGVGGLDCWVYLSGLEVLQKCEKLTDPHNPRLKAQNTAYIWDYVCRKLHNLGELCGLMPGSSQKPSSDQLRCVLELTSGMGLEEASEGSDVISPRDKLREALSSRVSFQRIYLEQSELAMGTFKYIGRFRSARMIGRNLAEFYMKLGEPQKAENYLLDAMTMYHQEGWKQLRDTARLDLARCQLKVAQHQKYVKTGCQVASSPLIDELDRRLHIDKVLDIAESTTLGPILLKAAPLLKVDSVLLSDTKLNVDQPFSVTVTMMSNAPCELSCDSIWLTLIDFVPEHSKLQKLKIPVSRQGSNSSLDGRNVMSLKRTKKQIPSSITLQEHFEGTLDNLVVTGIVCVNPHEVLHRSDSSGPIVAPRTAGDLVVKDMPAQQLWLKHVTLQPGETTLTFQSQGIPAGHYRLSQFGVQVRHLEFITELTSDFTVVVVTEETYCDIIPDDLVAGLWQDVTVHLYAGSSPVTAGSTLKVSSSGDLEIDTGCQDNIVRLDAAPRGSTIKWSMKLMQEPKVTSDGAENEILFDCSWMPHPLISTVTFCNPFIVTHKLLTAKEMKYVQVCVAGQSVSEFMMTSWKLEVTNCNDVELLSLNPVSRGLKLNVDQSASCVWQMKTNTSELPPLELMFSMSYRCLADEDNVSKQLSYKFNLDNFMTVYTVRVDISPSDDSKQCRTGHMAMLKIQVRQMPVSRPLGNQELMYEVIDQKHWSLHGKSTGVFSLSGGCYSTSLEVMPLVSGFLHVPQVVLYQYNGVTAEKDIWTKKADLEKAETLDSTDEDSSETDPDLPPIPTHTPLPAGQVYYSSSGKQVRVQPEKSTTDIEITQA